MCNPDAILTHVAAGLFLYLSSLMLLEGVIQTGVMISKLDSITENGQRREDSQIHRVPL